MQAKKLVMTGPATDICVQFTAMVAYLRRYEIDVPENCTAAESKSNKNQALRYMKRVMHCKISPSALFHFKIENKKPNRT